MVYGLALAQAEAAGPDADAQRAIEAQIAPLVKGSVDEFFNRLGQPKPSLVEVKTHADFGPSSLAGQTANVENLQVQVKMTTDQPPTTVREARQAIVRTLKGNGYRVDINATDVSQSQPFAAVTVEVVQPLSRAAINGTSEYLIFGLLVAACFFCLLFGAILLTLPLRGKKRGVAAKDQMREVPGPNPTVRVVGSSGFEPSRPVQSEPVINPMMVEPAVGLPPLPRSKPEPTSWPNPSSLPDYPVPKIDHQAVSPRAAPSEAGRSVLTTAASQGVGLDKTTDLKRLSREPQALVRQAFTGMPFDKALALLAKVDVETRQALIDKLQLKAPVRERLERELAALPPVRS